MASTPPSSSSPISNLVSKIRGRTQRLGSGDYRRLPLLGGGNGQQGPGGVSRMGRRGWLLILTPLGLLLILALIFLPLPTLLSRIPFLHPTLSTDPYHYRNDGLLSLSDQQTGWIKNWDSQTVNAIYNGRANVEVGSPRPVKGQVEMTREEGWVVADRIGKLMVDMEEQFPKEAPYNKGRKYSLESLTKLQSCLMTATCEPGESTVVIGASYHFTQLMHGHFAGEEMWMRSTIDAIEELGHTLVITATTDESILVHQAIPQLVANIMMEYDEIEECTDFETGEDGRPRFERECVRTSAFEEGLPVWKMFGAKWWRGASHPLGEPWTMSPEDYSLHSGMSGTNFFLGYSVQEECMGFKPTYNTSEGDRAFVYGKKWDYFYEQNNAFWTSNHTFEDMGKELGISFLAATGRADDVAADPGVTNMGQVPQPDYWNAVANSAVMLGIGLPWLSPTPYDSLCMGTPFINPVKDWDRENPDDRTRWECQQNALLGEHPPYVYHVHKHNLTELADAITAALANPIERYTPYHMTGEANRRRHKDWVNLDWRYLAEVRMEMMKKEGKVVPYIL